MFKYLFVNIHDITSLQHESGQTDFNPDINYSPPGDHGALQVTPSSINVILTKPRSSRYASDSHTTGLFEVSCHHRYMPLRRPPRSFMYWSYSRNLHQYF